MPSTSRVVITGIGAVSPFGVGRERFWDHVSRGCSGTRTITDFDATEFACRVAAPVSSVTIDDVPRMAGDDIWDAGYRAVMITDTAPYRYPYYHSPEDTPDKLIYPAFAKVTQGLAATAFRLAE